jgi:hypothetical protein
MGMKHPTNEMLRPVKVIASRPVFRADGRAAIALYFEGGEAVAIEVTPHVVRVLQKDLREIEKFFQTKPATKPT